jgi:branched-chain amino acid transport system substrate-binding protein
VRRALARTGTFLALLVFAACGEEKAPAGEGIPIGFYGALTGPQATFAQSGRNGARLAVDEINRTGGVLGVPLELLVEDDRNEPAEAASAVSKLITRDHVVALIGENASSRTLAAAPIAQSYRIPMVSPSSTNVEVTKKGDYIFRVCFTDAAQGRALAAFARRNLGAATAAMLVDSRSDYSVGLAEAFARDFAAAGGRIVAELKYTEGDNDFSAQLTAILPLSPEVLFIPGYYTDAGLIARQARGLGLKATLLGADGWDSSKLVEIGGQALEGACFSNHYSIEEPSPAVRQFVDAYRKEFGSPPDSIAALSYDAARLVADAIRRAGSTEGKRVRDALAATADFPGVTGSITFDAERNPVKPAVILKVEGGAFRYVASVSSQR